MELDPIQTPKERFGLDPLRYGHVSFVCCIDNENEEFGLGLNSSGNWTHWDWVMCPLCLVVGHMSQIQRVCTHHYKVFLVLDFERIF